MKHMTRLIALLLAMLTILTVPALAEVEKSSLLDTAFTMLEEDNIFLTRYNELTGSSVEAVFHYGLPYFFGGKHDDSLNGKPRFIAYAPEYAKRDCWENTHFYRKGSYYLYGFDCSGYTQWIYSEVGYPEHDKLDKMVNEWGKYQKNNHVYSHRKGKEMPSYPEVSENLIVGDLLVGKKGARHVMMFIGTLRDYGFTAEELPEMADYLDYPLVIHDGPNPMYNDRMAAYLAEKAEDPYYADVLLPDGGVAVSIIGVPKDALARMEEDNREYYYYTMPDGYQLTLWDLEACTSFCWFRINGIK